nr:MAG: capsid protein [Chemarfal virus 270]
MKRRKTGHSTHVPVGSLGFGYAEHYVHKRGIRQHRSRHSARFHGTVMSGEPEAKRHKGHEAHLIPGVDGHRIYGFPNSIITKLRYCTYLQLTCTAGARAMNVFAANGIFDPDITGVGHQPLWRDNYANIYDQYTVLGSKLTAVYAPETVAKNVLCGIVGDDDSTISTNVEYLMEANNSVSCLCGAVGAPPVALTQTFEPLKMFGTDTKDDGFSATSIAANPSELWCYGVWAAAADATSTIVVDVKIEIEYTVKFSELQTQSIN